MSLRIRIFLTLLLSVALPSFGQQPTVVEQPAATGQPIAGNPEVSSNPAFGEMVLEEPADWVEFDDVADHWLRGEFLLSWMKGATLPSLVTTSDAGTAIIDAGILGRGTTSVLLSGRVNPDPRPGFRFQGGYWLDREFGVRLEAGVSHLSSDTTDFNFNSTNFPIIGRPYNEIVGNATTPQAILVAHPDAVNGSTGSLSIHLKTGSFQDANIDLAESIFRSEDANIDAIFGYRFGRFADRIQFHQTVIPNDPLKGDSFISDDEFSALNIFHGIDFGFRGEVEYGDVSLTLLAKMAAGGLRRKIKVSGSQVATLNGVSTTSVGGVYALTPNIGSVSDTEFTVFPEYGATLQWRIRPNVRVHIGYRAMIMFNAIRAVDQIDFGINPDFLPPVANANSTPRKPGIVFNDDDFWIQSLTLGAEWKF